MTIENARALQEQLANEAIAQLRKNGSKELADDCIRSIAVVGKAWGIPADETARRQVTRTAGANAARWRRWTARGRSRFGYTAPCP